MKREHITTVRSIIALISVMLAGYLVVALVGLLSNIMLDRGEGGSLRDIAIVGMTVWMLGTLIIWRVSFALARLVMRRMGQKEKKKNVSPQSL